MTTLSRRTLLAALPGSTLLSPLACSAQPPAPNGKTATRARLGMNLSGPADWNTELPFVDVFRLSRAWISQRTGQGWGKGPALTLDKNGYVVRLEPGCYAETPLCTIEGGHYPGGDYTVLYDGVGSLGVTGAGTVVTHSPGRMVVRVDPRKGGFFLQLQQTDPANYVKNIRVLMPGFEKTYAADPFHPAFLARWHGVACLRFMDWMNTNNSAQEKWADRPTLASATWTEKGVPAETMCLLANRTGADAWICIPHKADDDYVRQLARLMKARIAPGRRVYLEYSNEVWNGQFAQSRYAGEQGLAAKIGEKPWDAAWHFTARRSVQIFKIWEQEWGGRDRLVRVLASQAGNVYVAEQILKFEDAYRQADVLAIAPYFGCTPSGDPKADLTATTVEKWSVTDALEYLEKTSLPESLKWVAQHKTLADKYGVKLACYEGGQHMVGIGGAENNETITRLFREANRDGRMGDLYARFLDGYAGAGGDLFCAFSSVSIWNKWGSWGAVEFADDDPRKSPKLMSLLRWAKKQGQPVTTPG